MLKINLRPADLAVGSRRLHYAWVMVGVASVMWTISTSIRFSATVLIPHLQAPDGLGWSYGAIALAFSLQWILTGITGPVMGWLGDRYGIRRTLVLGTVLFMAGMLLTGTMTQLWHFYLYFGLLLGAAMSVFQGPLVSGVTVWFRTSLGVAMGSFQAIQSLGTTLLIPLTAFLFARFGLTWTFWFPGLIGGVILLGLIRPFYNEPADIGLRPFGTPRDEPIRRLQRDDTAQYCSALLLHAPNES